MPNISTIKEKSLAWAIQLVIPDENDKINVSKVITIARELEVYLKETD